MWPGFLRVHRPVVASSSRRGLPNSFEKGDTIMKRTNTLLALGLAAALPVSGCATTHLGGAYRTTATDVSSKQEKRTLDEGSSIPLFWGLFEAGGYDANRELAKKLRPDEE